MCIRAFILSFIYGIRPDNCSKIWSHILFFSAEPSSVSWHPSLEVVDVHPNQYFIIEMFYWRAITNTLLHLIVMILSILSISQTADWFLILLGFAKNDVALYICSGWTLVRYSTPCVVTLITNLKRNCCKQNVLLESDREASKRPALFHIFCSCSSVFSKCHWLSVSSGILKVLTTCLLCLYYSGCEIWAISWQRIGQIFAETWFESKYFKIHSTYAKVAGIIKALCQEMNANL